MSEELKNELNLLFIADRKKGANEYWRLLDRIIQEIVLQQDGGTDPDVSPVDLHVKYVIERFVQSLLFFVI